MGSPSSTRFLIVLLLLLTTTLCACGENEKVPTYPVHGQVTFKGVPVTRGSVIFSSLDPHSTTALGTLDKEGRYSLTTLESEEGAPAGEYVVAVLSVEPPASNSEISTTPPKPLVPAKYLSLETSPLRESIRKGSPNEINIELQ